MNTNQQFIDILISLKPEEFIGLAQFLHIKVLTEEVDPETKTAIPRKSEDILMDLLDRYDHMGRRNRRELVRTLRRSL